jgi:glyoxylase-like metal-dependent hydrolase (beta-lactamase superfamily II)
MNESATDLLLRINGIQPAFGIEFGLASPRADEGRTNDPYRQANVSYSLVQRKDGQVIRHTLIDCGMGVVLSLLDFEYSHGVHVVHEVLLTHPHFDHFAQIDWLSKCLVRNGRADQLRVLAERPRPRPTHSGRAGRLPAAAAGCVRKDCHPLAKRPQIA